MFSAFVFLAVARKQIQKFHHQTCIPTSQVCEHNYNMFGEISIC